jgi:nitrogen regulatory protein PII
MPQRTRLRTGVKTGATALAVRAVRAVLPCMKRIEAFVKPHQIEAVKYALRDAGASGLTATEVVGLGHPGDECAESYRAQRIERAPRLKLEIVVHDDLVERVIEAIYRTVRPDPDRDRDILVLPVAEAFRIRTGEIDEAAIF